MFFLNILDIQHQRFSRKISVFLWLKSTFDSQKILFISILLLDMYVAHFQLKNPIKEVYDSRRNNEFKEIEEIRKPNGIWLKFKFSGYFLT